MHALLTGSTDGIGRAAAFHISRTGAVKTLVLHGRSADKVSSLAKELREGGPCNVELKIVLGDYSSLESVVELAEEVASVCPELNCVINNAGVLVDYHSLTKDGHEMTLGVNHVAPVVLTLKLLPLLERNKPSRLINVASMAHLYVGMSMAYKDEATGKTIRDGSPLTSIDFSKVNPKVSADFNPYFQYSLSKLGNVFFTTELERRMRLPENCERFKGVVVNCLHPGVIDTKLFNVLSHRLGSSFTPSAVDSGIITIMHLLTSEEGGLVSGRYFNEEGRIAAANAIAENIEEMQKFWQVTVTMWAEAFVDGRYKSLNAL